MSLARCDKHGQWNSDRMSQCPRCDIAPKSAPQREWDKTSAPRVDRQKTAPQVETPPCHECGCENGYHFLKCSSYQVDAETGAPIFPPATADQNRTSAAQKPLANPQDTVLTNGTDKPGEKGVTSASAAGSAPADMPSPRTYVSVSVHDAHCCKVHGCKYGYEYCPVFNGLENGIACEQCDNEDTEILQLQRELVAANARANEFICERLYMERTLASQNRKICEMEQNEKAYEEILGRKSYQEVADELADANEKLEDLEILYKLKGSGSETSEEILRQRAEAAEQDAKRLDAFERMGREDTAPWFYAGAWELYVNDKEKGRFPTLRAAIDALLAKEQPHAET